MAVIWMDPWETGGYGDPYVTTLTSLSTATTAGPWSAYSMYISSNSDQVGYYLTSSVSTLYFQARLRLSANVMVTDSMISFVSPNNVVQVSIGTDGAGHFRIWRGTESGTTLGSGSTLLFLDRWYYIQGKVVISDTAGEVVLKIDGNTETITWVTGTGTTQDTKADGSSSNVDRWYTSGNASRNHHIDDVVINDTTGTDNVSYPDNLGIEALMPNAAGNHADLTPLGGAAPSRFYFTNPAEDAAQVSPDPGGGWERTVDWGNGTTRGRLTPTRRGTALTTALDSTEGWTTNDDVLLGQFVGPPLAAQTISGTFKCYALAREAQTGYDLASQIIIRVVSEDGQTERAVLYAGQTETTDPPTLEWSTTATNRGFPRAGLLPASLSSYGCADGDRVVVELGFRAHTTEAAPLASNYVKIGDPVAGSDLPEDESTTTSTSVPWIEFSSGLTLSDKANWEMVDEVPANDATDYVYGSVVDDHDTYDLPATRWDTVAAVALSLRCQKTDAGAASIAHMLRYDSDANGTADTDDTGSDIALSTSWTYHIAIYDEHPDATAWTADKVDALQAGVKVR